MPWSNFRSFRDKSKPVTTLQIKPEKLQEIVRILSMIFELSISSLKKCSNSTENFLQCPLPQLLFLFLREVIQGLGSFLAYFFSVSQLYFSDSLIYEFLIVAIVLHRHFYLFYFFFFLLVRFFV